MNWHLVGSPLLGVVVTLALVGCSTTGTGAEETTTTGPPHPVTVATTTTTSPTTTTTSESTTTSTTIAATTTVGTIDPDAAQTDIAEAGDRWIASHDVVLDQVQAFNEANLGVAMEHDSIWAPVFDTDEGNVYALYATLAICAWADEGLSPEAMLDTILIGSTVVTDDPDELLFFTGLAVSGASNVFCPELSDTVRQVVPQN